MKNTVFIIVFIVLVIGVIAAGVWYSNKISGESQGAAMEEGLRAQQEQSHIMQNFKVEDVAVGTGAEAKSGDTVTVNYAGTLDDGTKFDSSYDRKQPFSFALGAGKVIRGWDLGVVGMKVGGKRTLVIPPELGYGPRTAGPIPPNSTLHFTVELLAVATSSGAK